MRWLSSSGASSRPWLQRPASEEPLLPKVGPKRLQQQARKRNTNLREFYLRNYQTSSHITWFMLTNLAVIKGLGSGGQAGHHSAWLLRRYHSSIATSDIRYYLRTRRMGSSSHVSSAVQLMLLCLRISSNSFSSTVEGGPSPGLLLSWITRPFIAPSGLHGSVKTRM